MPRPSTPEPFTRKSLALPDTLWLAISEHRHTERISSEIEAVRQLIQAGLDAEAKKKGRRG